MYTIKITLKGTDDEVWRRIIVPGACTLLKLNHMVQAAMGWTNSHLAEFEISKARYSTMRFNDSDFEEGFLDWSKYTVEDVLEEGTSFLFHYDFGDDWFHQLKVEKVDKLKGTLKKSACLDGAKACPPEDCGGVWGYEGILEALANPTPGDEEYDHLMEWLEDDGGFDPDNFDTEAITKDMRSALWQKMDY